MGNFEKFEIDSNLKDEINKEGWEKENQESGAAVLIGKKEEMEKLREQLENEGKTKDLGSYIRLHKELHLPSDEVPKNIKNEMEKQKGRYDFSRFGLTAVLKYVDKDGNFASVQILLLNIADLEKLAVSQNIPSFETKIEEELKKLGFGEKFNYSNPTDAVLMSALDKASHNYKRKLAEEVEKKKTGSFDF